MGVWVCCFMIQSMSSWGYTKSNWCVTNNSIKFIYFDTPGSSLSRIIVKIELLIKVVSFLKYEKLIFNKINKNFIRFIENFMFRF